MNECDKLSSELLQRTADAGLFSVIFMLVLIIILNLILRENRKFKKRVIQEYKKKNKL